MTARSGLDLLAERPSVSWLRERDIDLLLCAELHADGPLRERFAALCSSASPVFRGSWISHAELDDESDLIVCFETGNAQFVFLVENKIGAAFQPDQAQRYADRAIRWRQISGCNVTTLLVCPRAYLSRPTADVFDEVLSYEDMIEALHATRDPRSVFFATALADGIEAYRTGYVLVPDQTVSGVWQAIWRIAISEQPALNMDQPREKPGKSTWVYFNRPVGFSESDAKRCVIAYKAERGQLDLQFSSMTPAALAALLEDLIEHDMSIVKAGKSASVRVSVPLLDFTAPDLPQDDNIRAGLRQAERLRRFFVDNRIGVRLRTSHPM